MKLQSDERIIKVFRHHYIFFIMRGIKVWFASLPFFLVAYIFSSLFSPAVQFSIYLGVFILFGLTFLYDNLIYYLDTLIITNKRIVHLNWINPFQYDETECALDDIQNIETQENGFLSKLPIFDFGRFVLETASTRTVLTFDEAPDPENIKYFIVNIYRKHSQSLNINQRIEKGKLDFIHKTESLVSKLENK